MDRSYLVQRLKKPYAGNSLLGKDNPFAFGGGYKNGGLSDEAMDLLRGLFAFDYMGSAEFEFGAVPEALRSIAGCADRLVATHFTIPLNEVAPNWRAKDEPAPDGEGTVYLLCPEEWADEAKSRIREWAGEDYNQRLKEATHLSGTLRPHNTWDGEVVGWLELDNEFMFFTDREMWEGVCRLFGVEAR